MKLKLKKQEIISSLAFPLGIIVYALYKYIIDSWRYGGFEVTMLYQWGYIIAIGLGGVLPIILTLALKINTSRFVIPRLLITFGTLGFISVAEEFMGMRLVMRLLMLLVSVTVSALYFYKSRHAKLSEWIIIFISNPVFCYLIYYLLAVKSLMDFLEAQNAYQTFL